MASPNVLPILSQLQSDLQLAKSETAQTRTEWMPLELTWEGLFNYPTKTSFNFASTSRVIYMPNASGKSAILDIFLFALFDRSWRTNSRERAFLIHNDANEGWCELKFRASGSGVPSEYTIRRKISRDGTCEVSLTNEKGQVLNKLLAVNRKMVELVGEMDTLLQTMVLPQNYHDGCSILTMPTTNRKKLITHLFKVETRDRIEKWFKTQMSMAKQQLEEIAEKQSRLVKPLVVSAAALAKMEAEYLRNDAELANLVPLRAKVIELPAGVAQILENYSKYKAELATLSRLNYSGLVRELRDLITSAGVGRVRAWRTIVGRGGAGCTTVIRPVGDVLDELDAIDSGMVNLGARMDAISAMRRMGGWKDVHAEIKSITLATHATVDPGAVMDGDVEVYRRQLAQVLAEYERMKFLTKWIAEHEEMVKCIQAGTTTVEEQQMIRGEIERLERIRVVNTDLLASIRRAMEADVIAKQVEVESAKLREMRVVVEERIEALKAARESFVFKESPSESKFGEWTLHGGDFELSRGPGAGPVRLLSGYEKLIGEISLRRELAKMALVPTCSIMLLDEPFDSVSDENIPQVMRLLASNDIVWTSRLGGVPTPNPTPNKI